MNFTRRQESSEFDRFFVPAGTVDISPAIYRRGKDICRPRPLGTLELVKIQASLQDAKSFTRFPINKLLG